MNVNYLAQRLQEQVTGNVKINELMSRHTTWRIGGPADIFFTPLDKEELKNGLNFANVNKLPITIIGGGSNILVKDEGIRGLVINLCGLKNVEINGEHLKVEGGVKLPFLASLAASQGLTGLEFAAGIPGTVGGAIVMNAGAHGSSMEKVVIKAGVLDYQGNTTDLNHTQLEFGYRSSGLKSKQTIVVEAEFKLKKGNPLEIKEQMDTNLSFRKAKQPWQYPNAGSVFKNPPGDSAGRLIDAAGLKGLQIGGAQISQIHANFLINRDQAKAKDVLDLMEKIQEEVYKKFEIILEPEVLILGG
jgi:UDP-N-acetylmuramate dehydrogenase